LVLQWAFFTCDDHQLVYVTISRFRTVACHPYEPLSMNVTVVS
jgi:hypothetical protein